MFELINSPVLAAAFGSNLQSLAMSIIGPIFLVALAAISITFLVRRQMMQFVIFLVIGIVIAAVIYAPGFIVNTGTGLGNDSSFNW